MKRNYVYIIVLLAALALAFPMAANSDNLDLELDPELRAMLEGQEDISHYKFPEIAPESSAALGFRSVSSAGLRSLMRFGEIDDKVTFSAEYRSFHFPSRFYFVLDHVSTDDYFGELRYASGDTLFIRWVGSGLHRNPESVTPIDDNPATVFPGVSVGDRDAEYGVRKNTEDIYVRLKYPDLASHIYFRGWMVHEEGTIQERTLLGSGTFPEIVRDTARREYKWETHEVTVGANSHLGPMEVEVEHTDIEFKMNSDPASTSFYSALGISNTHHLYPDSTSSGNSIKFHTSYTGKLVASATLTTRETENDYSKVAADYTFGSAAVTWMPKTSFTMFLKYSRSDMDYDNSMQTGAAGIKNGISFTKDDLSLTARFRPTPRMVLKGRYKVEVTERDNTLEWNLSSDETTKTSYMLAAHSNQIKKLKLMADYIYTETDDPAYNTEADETHTTRLSADWRPTRRILAFGSYTSTAAKRENLTYPGTLDAVNRQSYTDCALAGITYVGSERFSTTLSYNYHLGSVKQDLVYDLAGAPAVAPDVLYEDRVNGLSLDMNYMANEKLSLRAGAYYSVSEGSMETGNLDLTEPVSVTSLSKRDVTDTTLMIGGDYELSHSVSLEAEYTYRELSEDYINVYDALENGDVQVATVKVSKKW